MENETWNGQADVKASEWKEALCSKGEGVVWLHEATPRDPAKDEVKRMMRSLLERFELSREDLVSAYDECMQERDGKEVRVERNDVVFVEAIQKQAPQLAAQLTAANNRKAICNDVQLNGTSEIAGAEMELQEAGDEEQSGEDEPTKIGSAQRKASESGTCGESSPESLSECSPRLEEKEEVDKMQTLVQSALRVYEASSIIPELGQKRRCLTLEDELSLKPSPFAQELLDRDQTVVAHAIKKYMNQYSVPQREVVEKTGLNQSHLSQHFLHGVTMKGSKRVKLYHWFEDDQKIRTGKPTSADSALNSVLESPKVEGSRRRPRWKWSPISTQILSEAFKKNHFPTREQRVELARVCNEAELTMNNGSPIRGPEGDTEGITEQRVNTWFTNRRKGLSSPSPTRGGLAMTTNNTIFAHSLPPLLRAATPTTPTQSYSHTLEPMEYHRNEDWSSSVSVSPPLTAVHTLVSRSAGSTVRLAGTATGTAQALPLTTITLPGGASGAVLAPGTSLAALSQSQTSSAPQPLQTFTINHDGGGIPAAAIIPPSQLQAILSQVAGSSDPNCLPAQIQLTNSTGSIFTIPMFHPQKMTAAAITPSQLHTYTVKSSPVAAFPSSTNSPIFPSSYSSPTTFTAIPTLTQSQAPLTPSSLPTIIGSNQIQALLSQLQSQAKLQGLPHVQFNPTSSLPLTITLPGASNEDISRAQALLINPQVNS